AATHLADGLDAGRDESAAARAVVRLVAAAAAAGAALEPVTTAASIELLDDDARLLDAAALRAGLDPAGPHAVRARGDAVSRARTRRAADLDELARDRDRRGDRIRDRSHRR